MSRLYVEGPWGQLHLHLDGPPRSSTPPGEEQAKVEAAPLICLPPAPSSGLYMTTLTAALAARGRACAALDYPGYGASDPTPAPPTIADYARAALAASDALSPNRPVPLLGFHSGCLVAVEAARLAPHRVSALVLIDVPCLELEARSALAAKLGAPPTRTWDLTETLAGPWAFSMTQRRAHVAYERAYALFIEHARGGAGMNAAFAAAFAYPCEARLSELVTPTTLIATQSSLLEPTRRAAGLIPSATLVERLSLDAAVLEVGACVLADDVQAALAA